MKKNDLNIGQPLFTNKGIQSEEGEMIVAFFYLA